MKVIQPANVSIDLSSDNQLQSRVSQLQIHLWAKSSLLDFVWLNELKILFTFLK